MSLPVKLPEHIFHYILTFLQYKDIEFRALKLSHDISNTINTFGIKPKIPHGSYKSIFGNRKVTLYQFAYDGDLTLAYIQGDFIQIITPTNKFMIREDYPDLYDSSPKSELDIHKQRIYNILYYNTELEEFPMKIRIELHKICWPFYGPFASRYASNSPFNMIEACAEKIQEYYNEMKEPDYTEYEWILDWDDVCTDENLARQ